MREGLLVERTPCQQQLDVVEDAVLVHFDRGLQLAAKVKTCTIATFDLRGTALYKQAC